MKKKAHTSGFKFKVVLELLKGNKTANEICQEFGIVSSQLYKWKKEFLEKGSEIFDNGKVKNTNEHDVQKLHATIGKLKVENDFLESALGRLGS